jgi:hypothetical protein
MSYVNKRIQSLINHADVCGGGMKKAGLVYASDWSRIHGKHGNILRSSTPHNIVFTLHGSMKTNECCGNIATKNTNPSQRAYRSTRGAFN